MQTKGQKVAYKRVSTLHQNPDNQLPGEEFDKVFIDHWTGLNTNRPAFKEMMSYVREGDTICVHALDRLSRRTSHIFIIIEELRSRNITLELRRENITVNCKNDYKTDMFIVINAAYAQAESELIKERQIEGIKRARESNKYMGRKPVIDEEKAKKICEMYADRYRVTDIAKKFKVSRPTIYNVLRETNLKTVDINK